MDKARISIIGTSNGINRKGYAMMLRGMPEAEIVCNASIGSSHSTLVPVVIDRALEQPADICVLDLCVNEMRAVVAGLYDMAETWRILDFFAARCTAAGVAPVILLLPRYHPQEGLQTLLTDLWRAACAERGLPVIDAAPIAQALAPGDIGSLWADLNHPDVPLSSALARALVRAARILRARPGTPETRPVHGYRLLADLHDDPVERVNTRFRQTFWRFEPGQEIEVTARPGEVIAGLSINAAHCSCPLRIAGDSVLEKGLVSILLDPARPMWHVIWNLVSPVASASGRFGLRAIPESEGGPAEDNDHRISGRDMPGLAPDHRPGVELAGLILRAEARPQAVARWPDLPDLSVDPGAGHD